MKERKVAKKNSRRLVISLLTIFVSTMIAIITISTFVFSIQKSVFKEKKNYLTSLTLTVSNLVDNSIYQYFDYCDVSSQIISSTLQDNDDINEFFENNYVKIDFEDTDIMLIDDKGTWYTTNNRYGRISDVSYYDSDSENQLCYMAHTIFSDNVCLVFRNRLENKILVKTESGTTNIEFCAIVVDVPLIEKKLSTAFPYECNRFLCDNNGLMLFKNFELGILIEGTNIFSKYRQVEFYFDDSEELLQRISNKEIIAAEFKLKDTRYFICSAPLGINDWSISYVMPSKSLSASSYINSIIIYVVAISFILVIFVSILFATLLKSKNDKKRLEIEVEANAHLQEASKAKSIFISNMSHDIRTPINGIMGMSYLAQKENNPPQTMECLKNIDKSASHLLSLVNDVLDMSSIENGKVVITNKPVNLIDLVNNCITILDGHLLDRDLKIIKEYNINNPYLMADELHFNQIIINILSNAIKYTLDGGKIFVRLKELNSNFETSVIRIEIEDTGIGMKPEFLDHIFEQFSQENGGSRTKYKGTGLGLAIVKKYVELMNGTITVDSVYEEGSKFTIDMPFEHVKEVNEVIDNVNLEGIKVLVAEDNEINAIIINQILEEHKMITTLVEDGKLALEAFEKSSLNEFDIVILDIQMPKMDGNEASIAIRNLSRDDSKAIPIIAMTANIIDANSEEFKEGPFNAYLSKPVDAKLLIQTIKGFISKKGGKQ